MYIITSMYVHNICATAPWIISVYFIFELNRSQGNKILFLVSGKIQHIPTLNRKNNYVAGINLTVCKLL